MWGNLVIIPVWVYNGLNLAVVNKENFINAGFFTPIYYLFRVNNKI